MTAHAQGQQPQMLPGIRTSPVLPSRDIAASDLSVVTYSSRSAALSENNTPATPRSPAVGRFRDAAPWRGRSRGCQEGAGSYNLGMSGEKSAVERDDGRLTCRQAPESRAAPKIRPPMPGHQGGERRGLQRLHGGAPLVQVPDHFQVPGGP